MENYDSKKDTELHIETVDLYLNIISSLLKDRGLVHDKSKLEEPEKSEFDRLTPKLKSLTYGSEEYKESLKDLGVALEHHYKNNSHHPEHYENGIDGFDLLDLIEMFCDWKAATRRMDNGDLSKSIEINKIRFNMSEQLVSIFKNTKERLSW